MARRVRPAAAGRALRALGRQYVSVRARLAVAPDHSEGLAHARRPDDPLRTGVAGSLFNPPLTITERSVISGQ
jgi:hypothetical protein